MCSRPSAPLASPPASSPPRITLSKLDHWTRLPWKFCGLAHAEEEVARRVAEAVKATLDHCPKAELHHRLTQKFLSGRLRDELTRFAEGVPFADLNAEFRTAVPPLRFIPVTETAIESKHAATGRLHAFWRNRKMPA